MGELDGHAAIVSGAGRGIGAAIARRLAREGASLTLASRTESEIDRLADELAPLGGGAIAVPTDVAEEKSVRECVDACAETFGGVDILVNNAGSQLIAPVALSESERWIEDFRVNMFGVYYFCKACLPLLARSPNGQIVNVSSRMAKSPAAMNSAYSASKAAVNAFTVSLAAEAARDGIRVNAVCPAFVETKLLNDSVASASRIMGIAPEEVKAILAQKSMLRRAVTPDEVAETVYFLITRATGMTGQAINVTGGAETH